MSQMGKGAEGPAAKGAAEGRDAGPWGRAETRDTWLPPSQSPSLTPLCSGPGRGPAPLLLGGA